MGYYTYYSMSMKNIKDRAEFEDIISKIKEYKLFEYCIFDKQCYYDFSHDGEIGGGDEAKWYDHEQDMRAISTFFPDVVFCLHGEGEDRDDLWNKYFKNGEMEACYARIEYDTPVNIEW